MKQKKCLVCKKEFSNTPNRSLKSWEKVKFCSRPCYAKYRSKVFRGKKHPMWIDGRSNEKKVCSICKNKFSANRNQRCCSPECMGKYYTLKGLKNGKNNGMYKGGRIERGGYILILKSEHPLSNKGYVLEHRLVMEKEIGRYLLPSEIVHHKNEIKNDNRIENLELMQKKEHDSFHSRKNHKGYTFDKSRNQWYVSISINGKMKYMGRYKTEKEAKEKVALAKTNAVLNL